MSDANIVERELDARHAAAQIAFSHRDLDAYRALFSPSLSYRQADGRVIGRDELMKNVASQFRRLSMTKSSFSREQFSVGGNEAAETIRQSATAEATAFGLLHRRWKIDRHAAYRWTKINGVWTIGSVSVFSETMTGDGWRLGVAKLG
jgi:Domain of unknown function (DUF4440)